MLNKKALAASVSAPPAIYPEDVFSCYLYTGNGSTQTINNGIDLAGKGGIVWTKSRSNTSNQYLVYSNGSSLDGLYPNLTNAAGPAGPPSGHVFNSNGFTIDGSSGLFNFSGYTYASWTFRKQPKFFDVVTYTGNGSNRTISHNLGSVPGMIIVKRTDTTGAWQVYHRSLANTEYSVLNTTAAVATGATRWNSTTPTSTVFSLGTDATVNANGGTYVAYLFAHDAGGFGTSGTDNIISCGSFTTDGSGNATVNLGYEPQYLMFKASSTTGNWFVADVMRGFSLTSNELLQPNTSGAEFSANWGNPTATGFTFDEGNLAPSTTFIYMAIRRPMKTPTSGTEVFSVTSGNFSTPYTVTTGFPVDLCYNSRTNGGSRALNDRLRGPAASTSYNFLQSNSTAAESTGSGIGIGFQSNTSIVDNDFATGGPAVWWNFKRATGFFDIVCYTGTGSAQNINHNLGVAPELMIVKQRNQAEGWAVYSASTGNNKYLRIYNTDAAITSSSMWNNTTPTASVFTVGTNSSTNESGFNLVAYLFATVAGVSKVGSYTGTGSAQTINCGFTAGARFVLIKRTDSTGDWYVWDTARGIVSGNDPYLLLNSTAAEVTNTDYIDPANSGFEISSTAPAAINANGGSFIFLAIA